LQEILHLDYQDPWIAGESVRQTLIEDLRQPGGICGLFGPRLFGSKRGANRDERA
jgi:hypothetical protein